MSVFFLDNQNGLMIGSAVAPNSTILTQFEYTALFAVTPTERQKKLAEWRAPKVEDTPAEAQA